MPENRNAEFNHLLRKSRDAKRGGRDAWAVQSTGEKVAVALVLNRADWLKSIRYTLAEAIDCPRRPNFDHPCRLNIDQGWKAARRAAVCG